MSSLQNVLIDIAPITKLPNRGSLIKTAFITFLLFVLSLKPVQAQYSMGQTGLMNIPTADWNNESTVKIGVNYLTRKVLPQPRFNYDSYNVYATINIFSFLEVTFREFMYKSNFPGILHGNEVLDRSFSIKFNVLKEGKRIPSFAIGTHDPFSSTNYSFNKCYYGVLSKHFDIDRSVLSASAGYYYSKANDTDGSKFTNVYDGPFGGICFQPAFYKSLKLMAEYDSMGFNVGAAVTLWKYLGIHCFTREFKGVVAGIRYECELLH